MSEKRHGDQWLKRAWQASAQPRTQQRGRTEDPPDHEAVEPVLGGLAGWCVHALAELLVAHLAFSLEHGDQHGPVEVVGEDLVEGPQEAVVDVVMYVDQMLLGLSDQWTTLPTYDM